MSKVAMEVLQAVSALRHWELEVVLLWVCYSSNSSPGLSRRCSHPHCSSVTSAYRLQKALPNAALTPWLVLAPRLLRLTLDRCYSVLCSDQVVLEVAGLRGLGVHLLLVGLHSTMIYCR